MAGTGGKRDGAGRPRGAVSKEKASLIRTAEASGELPHMFLLRVSQGHEIVTGGVGYVPTFEQRVAAANACAAYFAPKLAAVEHSGEIETLVPEIHVVLESNSTKV